MPGQDRPNLPQITRFIAGMVTNRNPIDTPFSIIGLNIVQHYDAMNDGLNMEVTAYNTLARRPGHTLFQTMPTGAGAVQEFFEYKDLQGNLSVFYDAGNKLYLGSTLVQGFLDANQTGWSLVGVGNFIYAANGTNIDRISSTALTATGPVGIQPLTLPPQTSIKTFSTPVFLSDFIPTNDQIGGVLTVADSTGNRVLSITITTGNVHFNVTLTGLPVSTQESYTEVDTQTVVSSTTTQVITETTGLTGTVTATGMTNGVINYFPNEGTSTLDFDVAYSGSLTIAGLVGMINNYQAFSRTLPAQIPLIAFGPLVLFVSATVVAGQVASTYYPDTPAQAISLIANGQ